MRLFLLGLCLTGCTVTHRVILSYEAPPGPDLNAVWVQQMTQRINDITTCLALSESKCIDLLEETRKETP